MSNRDRNNQLDVMKGILITLVVIGHAQGPVHRAIYLFHMAVFFLISGYLWNDKYAYNIIEFKKMLVKKVKSLYIPFVVCNLSFLILLIMFPIIYPENARFQEYSFESIVGAIIKVLCFRGRVTLSDSTWFLMVLFFDSIIFSIIYGIINKITHIEKRKHIILVGCLVFILFVGKILNSLQMNIYQIGTICSTIPIFGMGYLIKRYCQKLNEFINKYYVIVNLLSIFAIYVLLRIDLQEIRLIDNLYPNVGYFWCATLIGWFFILSLSKICERNIIINKGFLLLGRNSLDILCLHMLAFKIVMCLQCIVYQLDVKNISSYPVLDTKGEWWELYTVIGIVIPIVFRYMYLKIKVVFGHCVKEIQEGKIGAESKSN